MTERDHEEEPPVVIRDRRKIDPETGQPRRTESSDAHPGAAHPGGVDFGANAGADSATGAAPGAGAAGGGGVAGGEGAGTSAPGSPADQVADPVVTELAERTADLQRVTAEYANYRRRSERDRIAAAEVATAKVLDSLLPVLDDLDRAREHGDLDGAFAAVAEKLTTALSAVGLAAFGEKGDPFDPNRHEAVMHSESTDVAEPTCVQVLRPGYAVGERLIRPAMVAVADPVPGGGASVDPVAGPPPTEPGGQRNNDESNS